MLEENFNPEAEPGSPQEGAEVGDLSLEDNTPASHDPLDQITDTEQLRHEAKRFRGIANRKDKAPEPEPSDDEPEPTEEFMTKRDFYRVNEKKAIQNVTTENPEIKENWEAIKGFYTSRRGKDTPEEIAEDLKDAYILWKARNPGTPADPTMDMSTISVTTPSGTTPAPKAGNTDNDPRFNTASAPEKWYGGK